MGAGVFSFLVGLPDVNICGELTVVIVVHLGGEGDLVGPWDGGGEDPCLGVQTPHTGRVDRHRQAGVGEGGVQGCPARVVLPAVRNLFFFTGRMSDWGDS